MNWMRKTVKSVVFSCVAAMVLNAALVVPGMAGSFDRSKQSDFGKFLPVWNTQAAWSAPAQQPAAKAAPQAAAPARQSPITKTSSFSSVWAQAKPVAKVASPSVSRVSVQAKQSAKAAAPISTPAKSNSSFSSNSGSAKTQPRVVQAVVAAFSSSPRNTAPAKAQSPVSSPRQTTTSATAGSGSSVNSVVNSLGAFPQAGRLAFTSFVQTVNPIAVIPNITNVSIKVALTVSGTPLLSPEVAPSQITQVYVPNTPSNTIYKSFGVVVVDDARTMSDSEGNVYTGVLGAMPAGDRPGQVRSTTFMNYNRESNTAGFAAPGNDAIYITALGDPNDLRDIAHTFIHESGHRRSYLDANQTGKTCLLTTSLTGENVMGYFLDIDKTFTTLHNASTKSNDFPSTYARTSGTIGEDYADTYAYYYTGTRHGDSGGTKDFHDAARASGSPVLMGKFSYMVDQQTHTGSQGQDQNCTFVYEVDQTQITRQEVGLTKENVGGTLYNVPDYSTIYSIDHFSLTGGK